MNETQEARIVDIIPDARMPVTRGTLAWFEALYEAGALIYGPEGAVFLNPRVREVISAMHTVLGGGEVELRTVRPGDEVADRLEAMFDRAVDEAATANRHRVVGEILPYVP